MFTGIIEEIGSVIAIKKGAKSASLTIGCRIIMEDLKTGDSVSTNGVCLTATKINKTSFIADIMNETLIKSSLGSLTMGSRVNLERAMPANGRFGGHIVSGHIDGTGRITSIKKEDIAAWYRIKACPQLMEYVVEKGSIAIDGISLTVANVASDSFMVSIIPHTAGETTLSERKIGDLVNLENDIVGKYIKKFSHYNNGISKEFLYKNGF